MLVYISFYVITVDSTSLATMAWTHGPKENMIHMSLGLDHGSRSLGLAMHLGKKARLLAGG